MAQISIRMDDELKKKTEEVLEDLGLNISAAVNIFARQIVRTRGIPFPLTLTGTLAENRQEAEKTFVEYAKAHPDNLEQGHTYKKDECCDDGQEFC